MNPTRHNQLKSSVVSGEIDNRLVCMTPEEARELLDLKKTMYDYSTDFTLVPKELAHFVVQMIHEYTKQNIPTQLAQQMISDILYEMPETKMDF